MSRPLTPERRNQLRNGFLGAGLTRSELAWLLDRVEETEALEAEVKRLRKCSEARHASMDSNAFCGHCEPERAAEWAKRMPW